MAQTLNLDFPAAGVIRRLALRVALGGRGPFPAAWATNCRLEDALTNRLRGGSFTAISAGSRPSATYRDRAITFSSNIITAARQGDSSDTALSADVSDTRRPIIFQLAEADSTGGTVVAVAAHKDSYLLCWTAGETWVLAGDPAIGTLRRVSDNVGILGADAWCFAHDTCYFMSSDGLYSVGADGSGLKAVSADKIPSELRSVSDTAAKLTYQHSDRGVYMHFTDEDVDWFYDTARDGFWPFESVSGQSHVLFGPFTLGERNSYGRITKIQGTIAAGSGTVTWAIVPGTSEEAAAANGKLAIEAAIAGNSYSSYVQATGSWTAGRNNVAYSRTRDVAACLWLSATTDWAFEAAAFDIMRSGQWR